MIRSFGRHGVVHRSIFSQIIPPFLLTTSSTHRSLPRSSQTVLPHARLHRDFHTFLVSAPGAADVLRARAVAPHLVRLLSSTPPPAPTPKTATPDPPPSVPGTSAPRKPKVELRPAPVKPPGTSSAAGKTTKPLLADVSAPPDAAEVKADNKESILDAVKQDWRHASTHGVFAPPPPNAGRIGRLWHQAKEYFKFYLAGIKLINKHRVHAQELRARVKAGGAPLDRWETRFLATHQSDLVKLVPFVIIILLLEEVIPLIVLYAPFMLPSTCVLPSQRARIETKRREKQRAFALESRELFRPLAQGAPLPSGTPLTALCGMLSLSTFGPPPVRLRRLRSHLDKVAHDDALLIKEGMGDRLTQPELLEALEERGIISDDLTSKTQKARLRWWLTGMQAAEGDAIARRVQLVARSALGQF
ncbi:hypothetical protein FA95DRAFT_1485894 [Auriscalpium vulgare]|uniref:Uncharacterized protein n=1 Tax=Auriscalpium vulgare TaxID=40419 RepID=A0ACB8S4H8_9AGAM|nr:hypothetical protein FA95DRAFT_1485894 [Auriscalpium vulgare]